jgi:hypothetical protein
MENVLIEDEQQVGTEAFAEPITSAEPIIASPRIWSRLRNLAGRVARGAASAAEWVFGLISLILGLSMLAALPVIQVLSLGYFLESSARVARTGRLRDGLIGVRPAARIGCVAAAIWLALVPAWFLGSYARSAELIDPGGPAARNLRIGQVIVTMVSLLYIAVSCARGGRLRHFLWPWGHPLWLLRRLRKGGLYSEARDGLWAFVAGMLVPYYFRLGLVGFIGTLAWLAVPAILIGATQRFPVLGLLGAILLAVIVPFLPFLQVRYAVEGRVSALFSRRAIRDRFRRAPWAFAFSLFVLLAAAIPLYFLKLEMIPREAAWLPSLVFVIFLAPARLFTGWAYARSGRRDSPRHWIFRVLGRVAITAAALLYVAVVFGAQYTSWGGAGSLYEQHAFLLPVPFLNM